MSYSPCEPAGGVGDGAVSPPREVSVLQPRRSFLAASVLVLCAIAGCEKKQPPGADGGATPPAPGPAPVASAPVDADTILFGEVGSLTGAQATFGISTKNGIQMAIDEVNAAGGVTVDGKAKKIAVRVYDDQGKSEEAANAVTRLINQDKVTVILGEVASSNSLAMAPKAQAAGVPMITPSSTNPKVTEVGDFIFRVCFIDPFQGTVMAKFATETLKAKNVAILKDNKSDYSLGLTEFFTGTFKGLGGAIVAEEAYSQGDTDFRGQLTAIKGKNPDAIYVPGYYTDVGVVARQARELGLKVPLLGGDGWESEKLFELGGSAINGSYFSNHYSSDDPTPRVQNFIKNYAQKFGSKPDSLAALGYDAAMVAIEAIKRTGSVDGAKLKDAIAQTKDHPGIAGSITLDANRNAVKPAVILQVKDDKAVYVSTVNP
jgi:branched-chain amino acid transport system substrate-binding protein